MVDARKYITDETDVAEDFRKVDPCYGEVVVDGVTMQWYGELYPNDKDNEFRIITDVHVQNEEKRLNREKVYSNTDVISEEKALQILEENGWDYLE